MDRTRTDAFVGGLEAGGTKMVCAVGRSPQDVAQPNNRMVFPTGDDPAPLLAQVTAWFQAQEHQHHEKLQAIGIASFGPIDLALESPRYGSITTTPKRGWQHTDMIGPIKRAFADLPIGFDTDVNGGALGEWYWGAARGLSDFVYITLGTGIGAGGMARGQLLHGLVHPEMGHMRLPRVAADEFAGVCPFHGACWEGLCSGPALQARTGMAAEELPADHPAWQLEAQYVAWAIANIICVLSPQRVILGGSLSKAGQLGERAFFGLIQEHVQTALNAYLVAPALQGAGIQAYIVPPLLGDHAGICGAMALGQHAIG